MPITAKELAKKLKLSQTAVSMALNNKPGVSTETRRMVVEAAEKYGYDFTRLSLKKNKVGSNLRKNQNQIRIRNVEVM